MMMVLDCNQEASMASKPGAFLACWGSLHKLTHEPTQPASVKYSSRCKLGIESRGDGGR